jgi:CHAT domain/SIR2-like domain
VLASGGAATLDGIVSELRKGYDILYLVCHGTAVEGEPELWLEDEHGQPHIVEGSDFVDQLHDLAYRPRLVILASCRSAGAGDESRSNDNGVLAALGPRLAETGIPAVLAMQGDVRMTTLHEFLPVFLSQLDDHGQVDLAVAVARAKVFAKRQPDWWSPTLFMRLKSGRLWYAPGFGKQRDVKWDALLSHLEHGATTPILGPALPELLIGSRAEIAREWAGQFGFPMAPHNRESLPEVAQFLSISHDMKFPRYKLEEHVKRVLCRRYPEVLADADEQTTLDQLITTVARTRAQDPADPYRILAELPFPVYVSTDPTGALQSALTLVGKEPISEIFRWTWKLRKVPSVYDREPDYVPTVRRPLVYHLFGRLGVEGSVPLTQDDYLQFVMSWKSERETVPDVLLGRLTDSSLLFLGFKPDEWDFRILYQAINDPDGGQRADEYAHLAVQIDPEEGQILEPERAREYLEDYLKRHLVGIYWGGVDDFLRELWSRRGRMR